MATAEPRTLTPERRFLLPGIGWEGYEQMLKLVADRRIRLTYDRGDLELMALSHDHERLANLLGRMVETLTVELDLPCEGAGSTTWRRQARDRGLEADECYYLAHAEVVQGKKDIDLNVDPPPDLAIEVEITRSALDRLGVYAALGVPEVWRYDGESLRIHVLRDDGSYALAERSLCLPFLAVGEIVAWLDRAETMGQTAWGRAFQHWVRAELAPRLDAGRP